MASARRVRRVSTKDREKEAETMCAMGRRGFVKLMGLGTLGFGFGVSIFDSIFQYAVGADKTEDDRKHTLLTVGTVDFMGFRAKEITPNSEFYITTYSDKVPAVNNEARSLRIEGLVDKPYTRNSLVPTVHQLELQYRAA